MSGPKADAILARSGDPSIKKRKKKPKNEDYTSKLESGQGLMMRDEDEWNKGNDDVEMDEDAPGEFHPSHPEWTCRELTLACSGGQSSGNVQ